MTRSATILPACLGLAFGLGLGILAAPAVAEEGEFMKDMLGTMGIIPKSKEPIAYRDRAPLVVPPKNELRTPGTRSTASANPAWPNDPDVAARRRAGREAAEPATASEKRRWSSDHNLRLTPAEIQAGRVADHQRPVPGTHRGDNARDVILMNPRELRAGPKTADADPDNGIEPGRRSLTDPPSGMRKWAGGKAIKGDFTPKTDTTREEASPMHWLTSRFRKEEDEE